MNIMEQLKKYCRDVLADKSVSCQKHKWSCMRFLSDLERENTDEFPFVFDDSAAERFFRWMRLFRHRKGVLKGKHIEPSPIQLFVFGNVYGWKHRDTGYRRFKKLYWQVARKNAKSQSLAVVGSYELMAFDSEGVEVSEVYCGATKREQSKIVYDETVGILDKCKPLQGKYRVAYGKITHLKTGSIMRALSEEDRKTGDGLNPQCGIIDEYHAHETSEIYDVVDSGMGARPEPLLAIITTAGFDLENPCFRIEYDLVSKILNPDIPVNIESYFAMVNELEKNDGSEKIEVKGKTIPPGELIDDPFDPKVWSKANPIICSYPEGVKFLEEKAEEAQHAPEKMRNYLTKHMNVWVNQREGGYMNIARWNACAGDIPDLSGMTCYVGLDLSAKIDLTSVTFEFPYDDKYVVLSHSFMPEDTLSVKMQTDKVPYDQWVKAGYVTLTRGEVVDYRHVIEYAKTEIEKHGWRVAEWCFDPWGATQVSADLIDDGEEVVEIIQGPRTLSEPTKDFRNMVYMRRIIHDNNPVLTWAISNAVAEEVDRNANIILSKKKSRQRIDPIAATMNAHVRAMVAEPVSEDRVFFV